MESLRDIWHFLKARKKFWMAPVIVFLLIFAVLAILGSTNVLPYIYSIF